MRSQSILIVEDERRPNAGSARTKTTKYKGVTRIDRDAGRQSDGRRITATHGYMVRVFWRKERHQAFFSDLKYGDRESVVDREKCRVPGEFDCDAGK